MHPAADIRTVAPVAMVAVALVLMASEPARAQTSSPAATSSGPIERIKLTDNELNCAQIHAEVGQMDRLMADAKAAEDKDKTTGTAASAASTVADVAGKLGVFGRIGGLGGALFGQAAAQAGAGAVQKSSQESAQQMAERGKQAAARKEHLTVVFLAKECKASDLNAQGKALAAADLQKLAQAAAPTGTVAAAEAPVTPPPADAAAAGALVDQLASALRSSGLPEAVTVAAGGSSVKSVVAKSQKVVIAGYRVAFVDKTGTSASGQGRTTSSWNVRGDMKTFQTTQSQTKSLYMELTNVNPALMQAITDRLHADFVEQLKAKGLEVLPREALNQSQHFTSRVKFSQPKEGAVYTTSPTGDPRNYSVLSPTGMPLVFLAAEPLGDQGLINLDQMKGLMFSALDTQAVPLLVQVSIDFAETSSSGRSRMTNTADVDGRPAISVGPSVVTALHSTNTIMGEWGSAAIRQQVFVDGDYARVKSVDESPGALNAVSAALGFLTKTPALIQGTERRFFIADPARYAELTLKAGLAANRALAGSLK